MEREPEGPTAASSAQDGNLVSLKPHTQALTPCVGQLHQWLGRAVFLLGLAQIPLGLYVYGSPKTLFILYAVLAFLFILSWFCLEYLRNRGWFTHKYGGIPDGPARGLPEMSEHQASDIRRPNSDVETGYSRVGMEETPIQTPKKSRFSKMSWFGRRSSGRHNGETIGIPYDDGVSSIDTSRAPTVSPAMGGLAPGPGRSEEIPPVPRLPTQYGNQHSFGSLPSLDFQQSRHGNPTGLKDTVLRDSTTLGPRPGRTPLEMPEPQIPLSSHEQYPAPAFGGTPRSSGHSHRTGRSYQQPPGGRFEQMPQSPMSGGGYMEAEDGFVPTQAEGSPGRPLPLPPHRRDRSNDSGGGGGRAPIAGRSPDAGGQTAVVGEGEAGRRGAGAGGAPAAPAAAAATAAGGGPNVAVQVKLNPDGKSVTVRRLPAEEAERERRERSRARQERALQRELELERERQSTRRPQSSGRRPRQDTLESMDRSDLGPTDLGSQVSSTPSISGQSTTIAGASGGLLGRGQDVQTPSNDPSPLGAMSPLIGMQPLTRSPVPPGALSTSQRASVTSGTGTAENSEIEQEIVKEQRRRKRREERAGNGKGGGGGDAGDGGGYYGPQGPESQWT